jgi:hypothetical protein
MPSNNRDTISAFFSFVFQVENGVVWWTCIHQNTSGWLGPYNLILVPNKNNNNNTAGILSRYVTNAATDYLQAPEQCSIVAPTNFDSYVGAATVHTTIQHQKLSSE